MDTNINKPNEFPDRLGRNPDGPIRESRNYEEINRVYNTSNIQMNCEMNILKAKVIFANDKTRLESELNTFLSTPPLGIEIVNTSVVSTSTGIYYTIIYKEPIELL